MTTLRGLPFAKMMGDAEDAGHGVPFIHTVGSELETIAAMTEAFDAACKQLDDTGQPESVLEIIAERIIEAAKLGERDPVRLRKAALPWLAGE